MRPSHSTALGRFVGRCAAALAQDSGSMADLAAMEGLQRKPHAVMNMFTGESLGHGSAQAY
jgi:hypothetical protein